MSSVASSSQSSRDPGSRRPLLATNADDTEYTVEEALAHVGDGPFRFVVLTILGLAYSTGPAAILLIVFIEPNVRTAVQNPQPPCDQVSCKWDLSGTAVAMLSMTSLTGMAIGSVSLGTLSDVYGRRTTASAALLLLGVSGVLSAVAPNYAALLIFRSFVGIAAGASAVFFSMLAEYLPARHRGYLLSAFELAWASGSLYCVSAAWLILPPLGWRWLSAAIAFVPLLLVPLVASLPETPRYLLAVQKPASALKALETIARVNGKTLPNGRLLLPPPEPNRPAASFLLQQLMGLWSQQLWHATAALWFLSFMLGLGYYVTAILTAEVHHDERHQCDGDTVNWDDSDYLPILIDTSSELPAVLFMTSVIERLGRTKTQVAAWFFCALVALALLLFPSQQSLFLFGLRFWVMGLSVLIYVVTPEIFPSTLRGMACGTVAGLVRLGGMTTPFIGRTLYHRVGLEAVSGLLVGFFLMSTVVSVVLLPFETAGRAMTETVEATTPKIPRRGGDGSATVLMA